MDKSEVPRFLPTLYNTILNAWCSRTNGMSAAIS